LGAVFFLEEAGVFFPPPPKKLRMSIFVFAICRCCENVLCELRVSKRE
jgi:hypothetical protein